MLNRKIQLLTMSPSRGFMALYISRSIIYIAIGFFGVFLPIFLYKITNGNFVAVVLLYLLSSLGYALLMPIGMRLINHIGMKRALIFGTLLSAGYYGILSLTTEENWMVILPVITIVLIVFRLTYWVPYHTDFAEFTSKKNRGQGIGIRASTQSVIGIFTPIIAGIIISKFGFDALFIICMMLYIVAVIPLFHLPRVNEKFEWTFWQTWRNFFSPNHRNMILAFIANGAETGVGLVVWPIFLYLILNGNYLEIGALSTIIIAATIALQLWVGRWADQIDKFKLLHIGSGLYAMGWIVKIFIITAFQIFLVDAYHRIMKIFMMTPFDALTYDIAADEGHYIDEFTALKEMAVHVGRTIVFGVIIILYIALQLPLQWIFVVAAICAILINVLQVQKEK